jgi:hypothetical protein
MQIHNLQDIFREIDELYLYLRKNNISFDSNGLPVLKKEMFLSEWPDLVIPFSQRKNRVVVDKKKTVLCFFDSDSKLYPRLTKVFEEIEEYRQYMGVVELDVTLTADMDEEWQKAIALLNRLFLAVLAVNGIKVIANTRAQGLIAYNETPSIPQGVMIASGFLGCDKINNYFDFSYLEKVMSLLPGKLIIYGKHDSKVEEQLDTMGISFRVYKDFHRLSKEVYHGRQ